MSAVFIIVLIFFALAGGVGAVAYFTYQKKLRRAKAIERGLKMVPILIHLPPPSSDTNAANRDLREVMREKTSQAEVLYNLLAGTATEGFKSTFYGQRHIALELVVTQGIVHFYAAVPVALVSVVKKAVQTAYPGARLVEAEDHNIFNQEGRLAATLGGEMVLREESAYPIATYEQLERDPMEALLTTVSNLDKQDGVALQIMIRPANAGWVKRSAAVAEKLRKGKQSEVKFSAMDLAKAAVKAPEQQREEDRQHNGAQADVSQLQLSQVERIEEKTKHPGFEVLVRVIVSTGSTVRSQQLLRDLATTFALFDNPGLNGFKFLPAVDVQGLVTAFIFRFFPNELSSNILSSAELATLFHLPDSQFTPSSSVEREQTKQVDGPTQLSKAGLLFGYNEFRGVKKEIRLSEEDRRRHTYILGQTGTGKSTMLENLAVQDMLAGNGFAFIDPHGDSAEKLLALVPKNRAEDVIYFNPSDTEYPLGLNLFEFSDPAQKDFIVQETINMLYKLYDPGHTGIIGPRYEHWYRNAALTLMADPNGATFIEIPKVFTDTDYLKKKFKYLKDPTVIDFWTKEMGQTSDYHKSEMLGWFVSKFGAFQNNEMMRNIIGQTKNSFNIREVMDKKKILIVNLSKGRIGELNSQLLGMIFVIKFQAAAMSRADIPEDQRSDFALYVDEFQNFSTDSFASILSEARKYRLNLIVANQFIGQLSDQIRDAVFGNIGTIVAHRMGPEDAEFMVKQFAPVFDASDLVNIPNFQAAMRLMVGGLPSQPFSIMDSAPIGNANPEMGLAIKQLSAAKYGHDKALVEADIVSRLNAKPPVAVAPAPVKAEAAKPVSPGAGPAPSAVSPDLAMPAKPLTAEPLQAGKPEPGSVPAPVPVSAPPLVAEPPKQTDPVAAVALTNDAQTSPAPSTMMPPGSGIGGSIIPMSATPPPIGAPPLGVPPQDPQPASVAQVPTPAAPDGLVVTPPPIGAPPVDLTAVAPVFSDPAPAMQASNLAAQPQPLPVAPATPPVAPATPPAPANGVDELAQQIAAQGLMPQTAVQPAASITGGIISPPPIGAPPVDLPGVPQRPVGGVVAQGTNTLSISDITGGKAAQPRTSLDAVPLLGEAGQQQFMGDGEPLEDDPYAQIDLLAQPAPQVGEPAASNGSEPEPAGPQVGDGRPLADDPYAQIDILGDAPAAPQPEPPIMANEAGPAPVVVPDPQVMEQPAAVTIAQPVVPLRPPMPAPPIIPIPVVAAPISPVPVAPPVPVAAPAPVAVVAAIPPAPAVVPASGPLPMPVPARQAPAPVPQVPMPAASVADNRIFATAPASVPVQSDPVQSDWPDGPEPAAATEQRPVAAPAVTANTEPLIHFVDPMAESLLNQPDVPGIVLAEDDNKPAVSVAVPAPPAPAPTPAPTPQPSPPAPAPAGNSVPVAQVELAQSMAGGSAKPAEPIVGDQLVSVAESLPESMVPQEPAATPALAPAKQPVEPSATSTAATVVAQPAPPVPDAQPSQQAVEMPAPEPKPAPKLIMPVEKPASMAGDYELDNKDSAAEQIAKAENKIDDLLSVSLIKSDNTQTHRRLPDAVIPAASDEQPGGDLELNAQFGVQKPEVQVNDWAIGQHGIKVIQPLEPIVPEKEKFAKEIAELNHEAGGTASQAPPPLPSAGNAAQKPAQAALPQPQPTASMSQVAPPQAPAPVAPTFRPAPVPLSAAPVPDASAQPAPAIMKHSEPMVLSPAPTARPVDDEAMPVAQSLAATDVARARAERQMAGARPQAAGMPIRPAGAPVVPPPAKEDRQKALSVLQPPVPVQPAQPTESKPDEPRRRRMRQRGKDKPAEVIASKEEAEHNQPSKAAQEAASLTGKLILPTGQKPKSEPEHTNAPKPKKLAPGEVYVDDDGNVVIG